MDDYGLLGGLAEGFKQGLIAYKGEKSRLEGIEKEKLDRDYKKEQDQKDYDMRKLQFEAQDRARQSQENIELKTKGLIKTATGEVLPDENSLITQKQKVGLEGDKLGLLKTQAEIGKIKADASKPKSLSDPELKAASELRKEFQGRPGVKEFNIIDSAYKKIQSAAKNPSAAGDLSLIFGYMKLLDPNSTVREGEFATAQNAGGVDDTVVNLYNKAKSGERLNPSQRADFIKQAKGVYQAQAEQLSQIEDEFKGLSGRYGVDPGLIYQQRKGLIQEQPQQNTKVIGGKNYRKVPGGWEAVD